MHAPCEFAQFSFVAKIYANFLKNFLKLLMHRRENQGAGPTRGRRWVYKISIPLIPLIHLDQKFLNKIKHLTRVCELFQECMAPLQEFKQ